MESSRSLLTVTSVSQNSQASEITMALIRIKMCKQGTKEWQFSINYQIGEKNLAHLWKRDNVSPEYLILRAYGLSRPVQQGHFLRHSLFCTA